MSQKMLFNHNNDTDVGLDPKQSGLLLYILSHQSDDYIIQIRNTIEEFSKYKKSGTKRSLSHVQYVYRTLTNVVAFKSIISQLTKAQTRFLDFLCDRNGQVGWEEVKSAGFSEKFTQELCHFGLVFVFPNLENPKYVLLPIEYIYLLFSDNRDKESVLYVLSALGTEKVKQIADYLNERFKGNFDPSLSKASNVAFLYNFLMTRGEEIERILTKKQKEIISFVLQCGNEVELEVLLDRFTAYNIHAWDTSINTIFKNYFHRFQARQQGKMYTELQELFHMAVLVFANPEYSNNVFIPKEMFPLLARKFLTKIEAKKKKIMVEMLSGISDEMKGNSIDSLLYMLTKNIVTYLVYSYTKPTQNGLIPKTAIKKCARILRSDHAEQVDFLSIFLLLKGYITCNRKKSFVLQKKGEKFLFGNLSFLEFWKDIEDFFLKSIDWNELYKLPNRVRDYYSIPLNCDFKGLLYRRMLDIPHQWLKVEKFKEMLYADCDFLKIKNKYNNLEHNLEEHYPVLQESEFNDLDGMYSSILNSMYFLGLLDVVQSENGITYIKLSRTAIALATNKIMDVEQKRVCTQKKIILQPNGEIICMPDTQQNIMAELGKFAEIKKIDHTIIFELTSQSVVKGVTEFKLDFAKIMEFLTNHTGKELPQNITYLFKQLKAKEDLLTVGRCGGYIIVKDLIMLEEIKNIKSIKKHIADSSELPVLFLKSDAGIKEVLRELRKHGHLPKEVKDLEIEMEYRNRFDRYDEHEYF